MAFCRQKIIINKKKLFMKKNQSDLMKLSLTDLTVTEKCMVCGGGFFGDLFYTIGVSLRCVWEFSSGAARYQGTLPANLKK